MNMVRFLSFLLCVLAGPSACDSLSPFISDDELADRFDLDGDGVARPNDCDDDDPKVTSFELYSDVDKDGWGTGRSITGCAPSDVLSLKNGDCNDDDKNVYPGAIEVCDTRDNNCDRQIDEGFNKVYYQDADGDGDGRGAIVSSCQQTEKLVRTNTDCNDADDQIYPGATEVCDGKDNDCNGEIDEGFDKVYYLDADGDGYGRGAVTTSCEATRGLSRNDNDCNDEDPEVYPDAPEMCDNKDNDCNDETGVDEGFDKDYYRDLDNDGFGKGVVVSSCTPLNGLVRNKTDCNDEDPNVNPDAIEVCDNVDNNCVGGIDEGFDKTFYRDMDNDGLGRGAIIVACEQALGLSRFNTDCNDNEPLAFPGNVEVCDNVDNDCNGQIDEGFDKVYYADADADGIGRGAVVISCVDAQGLSRTNTDCNDEDPNVNPDAIEVCDNVDNNCVGGIDEGFDKVYYLDGDNDGFGRGGAVNSCTDAAGLSRVNTDCNDEDTTIFPNAPETCDEKDNDCDEAVDEESDKIFYLDGDLDGFGRGAVIYACLSAAGLSRVNTDCNDQDNDIYPGLIEVCDNKDNDCDLETDEGFDKVFYTDGDNDGFGRGAPVSACVQTNGLVRNNTDCDDDEQDVNPEAVEVCDNVDNNCVGGIDEGFDKVYYADVDRDGFGRGAIVRSCEDAIGLSRVNTDCNDADNEVFPGVVEICDLKDNNCVGGIDEGFNNRWYRDADGDGHGNPNVSTPACTQPVGFVQSSDDCDDRPVIGVNVYAGASEICDDLIDQDCNGLVDDAVGAVLYFADADSDRAGNPNVSHFACRAPASYVVNDDDCDDTTPNVGPNVPEACLDGIDNNCNGVIDDDAVDIDWFEDRDNDGFGNASVTQVGCAPPAGYVGNNDDCEDSLDTVKPGVEEVCNNGVDDNCDDSQNECRFTGIIEENVRMAKFTGENDVDEAGTRVLTGFMNDDDVLDLIITAPKRNAETPAAGVTYIFFGPILQSRALADADVKIRGANTSIRSGSALAVGDVNNDQRDDLIIASPDATIQGRIGTGIVYVLFGPFNQDRSIAEADVTFTGELRDDNVGKSVLIGDLNNDQVNDLVINSVNHSGTAINAGCAYVVFGPIVTSLSLADAHVKINGENSENRAGTGIAIGDLNDDQVNDLIISAPSHDRPNSRYVGKVYILFGPILNDHTLAESDVGLVGETLNDNAGTTVLVNDINSDEHDDLVISATGRDANGIRNSGTVYILFGPVAEDRELANADIIVNGENQDDPIGTSLSSGDVDNDGHNDLLIANSSDDSRLPRAGSVSLFYGPLQSGVVPFSSADARLFGTTTSENFGTSLSIADTDGDGVDDLLVGAKGLKNQDSLPGGAYIFFGLGL